MGDSTSTSSGASGGETFANDFKETRLEVLQTSVGRGMDADAVARVESATVRLRELEETAVHRMAGQEIDRGTIADFLRVKATQVLNDQQASEIADLRFAGNDPFMNNRAREKSADKRKAFNDAASAVANGEPLKGDTKDERRQLEPIRQALGVALSRLESEARAQGKPEHSAGLRSFVDSLPSPDSK